MIKNISSFNAIRLSLLRIHNNDINRNGLGYRDTVSLNDLSNALSTAAKRDFECRCEREQRNTMLCIIIAFAEGMRFKDVEDSVVEGTQLPDFKWKNHGNPSKVMIKPSQ